VKIENKEQAEAFINQYWPEAFYRGTRPTNDETGTLYEFSGSSDRYGFDYSMDKQWAQCDNSQDAWYFGEWCNPYDLLSVAYAEGDIYLVTFDSVDRFRSHMMDDRGDDFIGIDAWWPELKNRFIEIGMESLLH